MFVVFRKFYNLIVFRAKKIKITGVENLLKIRDLSEFTIDFSDLFSALEAEKNKIEKIEFIKDDKLKIHPAVADGGGNKFEGWKKIIL